MAFQSTTQPTNNTTNKPKIEEPTDQQIKNWIPLLSIASLLDPNTISTSRLSSPSTSIKSNDSITPPSPIAFPKFPTSNFPYIIYIYLKVSSENSSESKVYLSGQTIEKQFYWSIRSLSNPKEEFSITKAYIGFFENTQSDEPSFEINLLTGSIDWKNLAYSGISFYTTTKSSTNNIKNCFLIEKGDDWIQISTNSKVLYSSSRLINFKLLTQKRYKQELEININ